MIYKVGMKIKCIRGIQNCITVGKIYEITEVTKRVLWVTTDYGNGNIGIPFFNDYFKVIRNRGVLL
jgi:ribosomal 30S subunit maturation factor RimM